MHDARVEAKTAPSQPLLDPPETESPQTREPALGDSARWVPTPGDPTTVSLSAHSVPDLRTAQLLQELAVPLEDRAAERIREPPTLSTRFRHSGWAHNRELVARSLARTGQPHARRSEFAGCGSHSYVIKALDRPGVYRIAGSSCHDRFCLPCANERSRGIAMNVIEHVKDKELRFLTLTMKANQDPLDQQLGKIYDSFAALRRRAFWRKRVTGGIAFLELTYNDTAGTWHPHFHILVTGRYVPTRELSKLWYAITTDSFIVNIKAVRSQSHASHYVTKYASKPLNNSFLNRPGPLDEAVMALKGRKLLLTFGTFRGLQVVKKPDEASWEHVAPLEVVISAAAHGDPAAIRIMRCLTDADLAPIFSRAPPPQTHAPPETPPVSQLTFFAVWQASGTLAQRN